MLAVNNSSEESLPGVGGITPMFKFLNKVMLIKKVYTSRLTAEVGPTYKILRVGQDSNLQSTD